MLNMEQDRKELLANLHYSHINIQATNISQPVCSLFIIQRTLMKNMFPIPLILHL